MAPSQFLELRTLLTTQLVSMLICLVVMAILWWNTRERFPATTYWLSALALQFVSFTLILLRGRISDTISIVVAAVLVTTGFMQLVKGLALHLDRPYSSKHDYALQGVFVLIHAYFTYVAPSLLWRSVNYSVFLTWLCLECIWLIRRTPAEKRFAAQILGAIMGAYALLFAGRVVYYGFEPPAPDFFHSNSYDLLLYLGTQALLICLTFSFVLMVNRRLYHDLKEDARRRQRAEQIVHLNVERLARAELASKTGNWEFNLDTHLITSSLGAAKIYGLATTELDYEVIKTMPLAEYRPRLDAAMSNLIERSQPYDVEFRIRTADTGEQKDIRSTAEFNPTQRTVFGVIRDITEQKLIEHELEHLVQIDPLTGVFSRRHFMAMAERELANAARYHSALSVLMLDLDYFKQVNDTYGHQIGDIVLQKLGQIFKGLLREVDTVGRYGGEEFVVLLPKTELVRALEVSERLRFTVEHCQIDLERGLPLSVTISIGVTTLKSASENIDALLARADMALYDAKRGGRNRICVNEAQTTTAPA